MRNAWFQGRRLSAAMSVLLGIGIACITVLPAMGAEYFVNKQGNDANNGQGKERAFLTIQKGLTTIKAGDTLTIGPGEYLENVTRENLGSANADTLIRAEIAGTATLRGDVPAPEFKLVDGYRFVYTAPFAQKPQAVLEHDTLRVMMAKASPSELEFDPGYFHYDAAAKMLYISRADLLSPEQRHYSVVVNEKSGFELINPRRVIIDGLATTGFCPGWGIRLAVPVSCTVRNCVSFMNIGGIVLDPMEGVGRGEGGSKNVVENCVAYGNAFGGIVRYGANGDVIQNCYTYRNVGDGEHFGVMHYSTMTGPLLIKNNISWGQNFNYSVKQGDQQERLENCVGLGFIRISTNKMSHNLIGGGNEYDRGSSEAPADTVLFDRERDLNKDVEYADPVNLDFRLQPNSRFRGSAPDKSDRGPYKYEANIFYASPSGNDQADGLSSRTPWRTLERAVTGLRPGDTLYLMKGSYAAANWKNPAGAGKPINVRGRGRDAVLITGRMVMSGGSGVNFERVNFTGGMALEGSSNVTFKNCTFAGAMEGLNAQSVKGLRVTNAIFTDAPLSLATSSGVFLAGNLFANSGKPAVQVDSEAGILYSDYNNYKDAASSWQVGGATLALAGLQKRHDVYSLNIDPQIAMEAGVPVLKNATPFAGRGFQGTALGAHYEYKEQAEELSMVGPLLHSVTDTTANIEWWISAPAKYTVRWGDTPEMKTDLWFNGPERFVSFSLTGLQPGRTYYFNIETADPSDRNAAVSLPVLHPKNARLTFKTALQPSEPRVYHVAPNGDDGNDGLSRERAFKTANCAATKVGPGDTVLMYTGKYNETVRIRAAGTKDRPITFRAAPGEKPAFDGDYLLKTFIMMFKPDYRFDGLYLSAEEFWGEGYVIRYCDRVQITRCLNITVTAQNSSDMVIRNCVTRGGWSAIGLGQCPNSIVENNVSIMTILRHVSAGSATILRNNIFAECIRNKAHQQLLDLDLANVKESNNCFYIRWPADEKLAVNDETLTTYKARHGSDSFAANPMMPGTPGWRQGWQQSSDKDFDEFFSTNPELIVRNIGLQPEAFSDFRFEGPKWPYNRAWAEGVLKARNDADALAKAGKDAEALTAYTTLAAKAQMSDRLKADVLERAYQCAFRMKNYVRAMQLAKSIPTEVISVKCQMQVMLAQKQYTALLNAFADRSMGGRSFASSFMYPELEDVMADLYYYRSIAYAETKNLDAAEADLKVMNDKRSAMQYSSGEAIHDLTWLRLGDFYRQYRKDDIKALDAYLQVCERTTYAPHGTVPKPVLTGASATLAAATKSACEILAKQGKAADVKKWQASLQKAQADAAAALRK